MLESRRGRGREREGEGGREREGEGGRGRERWFVQVERELVASCTFV